MYMYIFFKYFAEKEKKEPKQHLDAFLSKNTSEDNASFVEILEENEKKHREKHAWLFENEDCRTEVTYAIKLLNIRTPEKLL